MTRACVVVLAVIAIFAARPAYAATRVACVGDSITQNSGYSDRLGARLGAGYTAINYGVSATTLLKRGDLPYWNTGAFTQSHSSDPNLAPNIVVIMLGTNDSKPWNWNAHKAEFVADYEALIDSYSALASRPKIFVSLCPPAGTNSFGISGSVIENEMLPLIRQVAAAKGAGVIDVFSAFGGRNFNPALYAGPGDQVHPNGAGAQRIADTVHAALVAAADGGTGDAALEAAGDTASDSVDATADGPNAGAAEASNARDVGGGDTAADAGTPAPAPDARGSDGAAIADAPAASDTAAPPVSEGDSGCGCRLSSSLNPPVAWFALISVALVIARGRRPRRRSGLRPPRMLR